MCVDNNLVNINLLDPNCQILRNSPWTSSTENGIPNFEDIRSFVELSMKPKNPNFIEYNGDEISSRSTVQDSTILKLGGDFTNKDGETYYSTRYTDELMGGNNSTENNYEGFGINSVDIVYDANKIPQVTVVFYDLRGNVLNDFNSKYAKMFQLPYPIFQLKIKGGFGPIIEYRLLKIRDDISVDESGNYIITSKFIGDRFSPLSDLPLLYLMAVPYLKNGTDVNIQDEFIESFLELINSSKRLYEKLNQALESDVEQTNEAEFQKLLEEKTNYQQKLETIKNKENFLNWFKEDVKFISFSQSLKDTVINYVNSCTFDFKNNKINFPSLTNISLSSQFYTYIREIVEKNVDILDNNEDVIIYDYKTFNAQLVIDFIDYTGLIIKINDKDKQILEKGYKFHNDRYVRISNLPTQVLGETKLSIGNIFKLIFNDYNYLMSRIKKAGDSGYNDIVNTKNRNQQTFDKMGFPTVIQDGKLVYPGIINEFKNWSEVIFIEEFIDAYYQALKDTIISDSLLNREEDGRSKYIPINPREFYTFVNNEPYKNNVENIYFRKTNKEFYQLIYERFLCLVNININFQNLTPNEYTNWNNTQDVKQDWLTFIKELFVDKNVDSINIKKSLFFLMAEIEARNIAYSVSLDDKLKKDLTQLSNTFSDNFFYEKVNDNFVNKNHELFKATVNDGKSLPLYNNIKIIDDNYVTFSTISPDKNLISDGSQPSDIISTFMKTLHDTNDKYKITKDNIFYIPDTKLKNGNESDYDSTFPFKSLQKQLDEDGYISTLVDRFDNTIENMQTVFDLGLLYDNARYPCLIQIPRGILIVLGGLLKANVDFYPNKDILDITIFFKTLNRPFNDEKKLYIKKGTPIYNYLLEEYNLSRVKFGFSYSYYINTIVPSLSDVNVIRIKRTIDSPGNSEQIIEYFYQKTYLSVNDFSFTSYNTNNVLDELLIGNIESDTLYTQYLKVLLPKVAQFIKEDDKKIQDKLKSFGSYVNDPDVKLAIYKSFQVIYENYLHGIEETNILLSVSDNDTSSFKFVDRAYKNIGNDCILDVKTLLNDVNDTDVSLLSAISRLLSDNNFWFYPFQSFITTTKNYNTLFDINLNNPETTKPVFVAMYVGALSSNPNNDFNTSSIQNDGISKDKIPADFGTGLNAFLVKFTGLQNQSVFSNFQISTESLKNTDEGLRIQSEIINNASNSYAIPKGQSLLNVYQKQSYVTTVKIPFGNMGIQPTQYFYQEYMPLFDGLYIIHNVTHSINADTQRLETTFKGYRLKKDTNPIITQQFVDFLNNDIYTQGLNDLGYTQNTTLPPFNPSDDFYTNARRFVIPKEGFVDHVYWDVNNWRTGYGSEIFALDGALTAKGDDRFNGKYYRTLPSDKTQWPRHIDLATGIINFKKIDNGHVEKYNYNKSLIKRGLAQWDAARNNDKYKGDVTKFYTKNHADKAFDFTFKKFLDITRAVNPTGFAKLGQKAQIALTYVSYGFGSIRSKDPNMINIRAAIASGSDADAAIALIKDLATKDGNWVKQTYYNSAKYIDSNIYNNISSDLQEKLKQYQIYL
jgi:hypothetical protein